MTLSVAGIGRRKIGGPLGAGQPERLAHGPLGEGGDPRGVEHATFAVQRMQAHEPFDLAGYDRHARPGGLSAPHDLARRLADERRLVERPLAGDHELRFGEGGIESHSGQNPLRAARELGLGEIREPRAQSARGTAPGEHRQVSPAVPGHQRREALESPGKELHTFGPRSLLWPEHRRRALWADQRRGHVRERNDARGEAPSPLKFRQLGQRPASFGKRLAVGVEERPAKSPSRAGPAVYRGGPPQTHDHRLRAPFDRLPDQPPTPRDVARSGSSCSGLRSAIPQAVALSKIAVSGSTQPSSPDTDSPKGPATVMRSRNEPRGRTASRSPSPPSEMGS